MLITDKEKLKEYTSEKRLWQGIPSIEVTKGGRTFLSFYSGGIREDIGNYSMIFVSDDGVNFGEPIAAAFEKGYRCYDPCVWIDPLGRLWFTWTRYPETGLFGAICEDPDADEIVFGEEFFIGHNVMMNKPTVLSTGEWAFPLAVWSDEASGWVSQGKNEKSHSGAHLYITDDDGKTFKDVGYALVKERSFDEHIFLEMSDGRIRAFVRTKYGIGAADSYDRGANFGESFDTGFGGPCSRFHIRRLPSGRILLVNHYDFSGRNNLTAMLSEDDGKTFPYKLLLDERSNVSYPDAALAPDGGICITYDRERGSFLSNLEEVYRSAREILVARVTEEDIIKGSITDEKSYLKRVCSKLGEYKGDEYIFEKSLISPIYGPKTADEVVDFLFDMYGVNCINIHNIDAETLDLLLEDYRNNKSVKTLGKIIEFIKNASGEKTTFDKQIVDDICAYISDNLDKNDSITEIAKKFNYSYNYLRHIFKKHTGTNINSFRTSMRITRAKILLTGCDDKITDIAFECGFENSSYFTEIFKRETGVTPSEYRNRKNDK